MSSFTKQLFFSFQNFLNRKCLTSRLNFSSLSQENKFLIHNDNFSEITSEKRVDALDKVNSKNIHIVDRIRPTLKKSFNLAAYINSSETLQELLKLEVDISKIDKYLSLASYLLKADFKTDIEPHIKFLINNGIQPNELGTVLNRNSFLFVIPLDNLQVRINYFHFRKFSKSQVATILLKGSNIFNFDTKQIDSRLEYLCQEYKLLPDQLRHVITSYPRIIEIDAIEIKKCTFMFREEMGFNEEEIKNILLLYPILWLKFFRYNRHREYIRIFDYLHTEMGISHEMISKTPNIFNRRFSLIHPRHKYLKKLNRVQYDPKKPLFVPLTAFFQINDNEFCVKYAKTSLEDFETFLKSL